jgi:hypothetical protein
VLQAIIHWIAAVEVSERKTSDGFSLYVQTAFFLEGSYATMPPGTPPNSHVSGRTVAGFAGDRLGVGDLGDEGRNCRLATP